MVHPCLDYEQHFGMESQVSSSLKAVNDDFHKSPDVTAAPLASEVTPRQTISLSPFLNLPGEIRNKIYRYTYIASRHRPPIYNAPDFLIHGDTDPSRPHHRGGLRWLNISNFNLPLVCKQTHIEVLPVISSLIHYQIQTYAEPSSCIQHTFRALKSATDLCSNARKVTLDINNTHPRLTFHHFVGQLRRVSEALSEYPRLREVEVRLSVTYWTPVALQFLSPVFGLARKETVSIIVALEYMETMYKDFKRGKSDFEATFWKLVREHGGRKSQVWLEWVRLSPLPIERRLV